jgi:hypothetical protein
MKAGAVATQKTSRKSSLLIAIRAIAVWESRQEMLFEMIESLYPRLDIETAFARPGCRGI